MPKEKTYKGVIERIYKRNYEDIGMFFFVEAQRQIVPAITIEKAIDNYCRFIGVKDFNHDSAVTTYSRMKREFYEAAKTNIGNC